jgi:Putative peptidoglycan binding domain
MPYHNKVLVEWLGSIAADFGHKTWRPIYEHANNSTLRSRRPEPNLLAKGDRIYVPPPNPKEEHGGTEATHVFELDFDQDKFQIRILDLDMYLNAFGAIQYSLTIGSQTSEDELTASNQVIELPLEMEVSEGELNIGGYVIPLKIGALEPHDRVAGLQARITNLGFDPGPIDNIAGRKTKRGIEDFQLRYGITVDGSHGAPVMNKVKEIYGC